jgi:hypothetical protein
MDAEVHTENDADRDAGVADRRRDPAGAGSGSPTAPPPDAPNQLRLLDAPVTRDWRLDESTREVGRRGIELARQALEAARRRDAAHDRASGASTAA